MTKSELRNLTPIPAESTKCKNARKGVFVFWLERKQTALLPCRIERRSHVPKVQ